MMERIELVLCYSKVVADLSGQEGMDEKLIDQAIDILNARLYELTVVWNEELHKEIEQQKDWAEIEAWGLELRQAKKRHPSVTGFIPRIPDEEL